MSYDLLNWGKYGSPTGIQDRIKIKGLEIEVEEIITSVNDDKNGYLSVELSGKVDDCNFTYSLVINLKNLSVYRKCYKLKRIDNSKYKSICDIFIMIYINRIFCYGKWRGIGYSKFNEYIDFWNRMWWHSEESSGRHSIYQTPKEIEARFLGNKIE